MVTKFRNVSDVMPVNRVKAIHSVGWVAQFEFNGDSDTLYTGVFQGTSSGIIRFSLAKEYSDSNISPGVGIKFLRDNHPSCNIGALPNIDGQEEKNFFLNVFKNHNDVPAGISGKVILKKFQEASNCPLNIGLSDCSQITVKGETLSWHDANFPFELLFVPTKDVQCEKCDSKQDI